MKDKKETLREIAKLILLAIIATIAILVCECRSAHAGTVTGERAVGGFSLLRNMVFDIYGEEINGEDLDLLANVIYWENYSNGHEAMILTGSVVLNRVEHKEYPNTIKGVLYQPGQYATTGKFYTTEIPKEVRDIALHLLLCGSKAPENVIFQSMQARLGSGIWREINGEYFNYE